MEYVDPLELFPSPCFFPVPCSPTVGPVAATAIAPADVHQSDTILTRATQFVGFAWAVQSFPPIVSLRIVSR